MSSGGGLGVLDIAIAVALGILLASDEGAFDAKAAPLPETKAPVVETMQPKAVQPVTVYAPVPAP